MPEPVNIHDRDGGQIRLAALDASKTKPIMAAIETPDSVGAHSVQAAADLQKRGFGADDYYVKPHDYAEMENIVREFGSGFLPANLPQQNDQGTCCTRATKFQMLSWFPLFNHSRRVKMLASRLVWT